MSWTGWVTFAIAVIGAALGIFNTWQGWRDRAVRLRILPTHATPVDHHGRAINLPCISIEVQNLGTFPVTVEEVGLLIGKARGNLPARAPIPKSAKIGGPDLPHRIDRHEAFTITFPVEELPPRDFTAAYARTSSGYLAQGMSPALKDIIAAISSAARKAGAMR